MNFNTLVNTQGIKGSRRGGATSGFKKAAVVTKDIAVKTVTTIGGWAPATTNRVNRVESESLGRDRELIYELRKDRERINLISEMLGLDPITVSTEEEVREALDIMETHTEELKAQAKAEEPSNSILRKLQEAIATINKHLPEETPPSMEEAVVEAPIQSPVQETVKEPKTGTTRRLVSAPEASAYDYSELTEDTAATTEDK